MRLKAIQNLQAMDSGSMGFRRFGVGQNSLRESIADCYPNFIRVGNIESAPRDSSINQSHWLR